MQEQTTQLPWKEPTWLDQASAWIHAQVAAYGWQSLSPVEVVRLRPWSAFARVATTNGIAYFKATASDCHDEAALTQALAHWRSHCTVPLLAVDLGRGCLLSANAGPTPARGRSVHRSVCPLAEHAADQGRKPGVQGWHSGCDSLR